MAVNGAERREEILKLLRDSDKPIAGMELARRLGVSRQIIVQDMALIRANGTQIVSTNRGYLVSERTDTYRRVFKVIHTDAQVEEELNLFVDHGGKVEDVFVFHKVYGVIRAEMNIRSRQDVKRYMEEISGGKSTNLKNLTSDYHYHTILAEDVQTLNLIQQELARKNFLAKLQDYEPVDFWKFELEE